MLGTFADHGVEVFTPWDWHPSWWEVLHLFSRYAGTRRVASHVDAAAPVLAFSSLDASGKRLTVILLNNSPDRAATARVSATGFVPVDKPAITLRLAHLPENKRTFQSDTQNALRRGTVPLRQGVAEVRLPPYSITALVLSGSLKPR